MASKKAKWIVGILLGLVALVVIVVVVVLASLGTIVEKTFEMGGPRLLGVETRLDDAAIGLLSGTVDLHGLAVGNPEGFSAPHFLKAARIKVRANVMAFLDNEIHVRELILDAPEFTFEYKRGGSNVSKLMERLESGEKKPEAPGEEPEEKDAQPVKLRIDLVRVTNAKIKAVVASQTVAISLPEVKITDLSDNGKGIPPAQILKIILAQIKNPAENLLNVSEIAGAVRELGAGLAEGAGKGLGHTKETVKEGGKAISDSVKEAGKGLKNLGKGLFNK